jgi:hypothetical protein
VRCNDTPIISLQLLRLICRLPPPALTQPRFPAARQPNAAEDLARARASHAHVAHVAPARPPANRTPPPPPPPQGSRKPRPHRTPDCDSVDGTIRGRWGPGRLHRLRLRLRRRLLPRPTTRTPEDAAAATLRAGLDLDCGSFLALYAGSVVVAAKVADTDVDAALLNTVTVQMRLGMFNGDPAAGPFGRLGPADVCSREHQDLALDAARTVSCSSRTGAAPSTTGTCSRSAPPFGLKSSRDPRDKSIWD